MIVTKFSMIEETERNNQTVESSLRCFINFHQDNWVDLIDLAELGYNSVEDSTINTTSFEANCGRNITPLQLHPYTRKSLSANADELAKALQAFQDEITTRVSAASQSWCTPGWIEKLANKCYFAF